MDSKNFKIITLMENEDCKHTVYTKDENYRFSKGSISNSQFKLDSFQEEACGVITGGESLLLVAHTSSGKTLVAEHAIKECLDAGKKIFYTSPIKALSYQLFNNFKEKFGQDVGIITGDKKENIRANVLIMTTEILFEMLLSKDKSVQDVGIIILDEFHYIGDEFRGNVWEQTVSLTPVDTNLLLLTGTLENSSIIMEWIFNLFGKPVHLIETKYRKVPLEVCLFSPLKKKSFQVKKNGIKEEMVEKIYNYIPDDSNDKENLLAVVEEIKEKQAFPALCFCGTMNTIKTYSKHLRNISLVDEKDVKYIEKIFNIIFNKFDEKHPIHIELVALKDLYCRGIGIHYSNLMTITKQVTERLYKERMIKLVLTTETLSVGVNLPTKTVIFMSTKKFDGACHRYLSINEYNQMCGRAGRRGIDKTGIVILVADKKLEKHRLMKYLFSESGQVKSQFHLNSSRILSLCKFNYSLQWYSDRLLLSYETGSSQDVYHKIDLKKKFLMKEGYLDMNEEITEKGELLVSLKFDNSFELVEILYSSTVEKKSSNDLLKILCYCMKPDAPDDDTGRDEFFEKIEKIFRDIFNKKMKFGLIPRSCTYKTGCTPNYYEPIKNIFMGDDIKQVSNFYNVQAGLLLKKIILLKKIVIKLLAVDTGVTISLKYQLEHLLESLENFAKLDVQI